MPKIIARCVCRSGAICDEEIILHEFKGGDEDEDLDLADEASEYRLLLYFNDGFGGGASITIYRQHVESAPIQYAVEIDRGENRRYYGACTLDDAFRLIGLVFPAYMLTAPFTASST